MTKEELKIPITEVVRKNDMRNCHGKNLHILLGILDYIDSNISYYDTDGNVVLKKRGSNC
jgi:hypothetical protein